MPLAQGPVGSLPQPFQVRPQIFPEIPPITAGPLITGLSAIVVVSPAISNVNAMSETLLPIQKTINLRPWNRAPEVCE